MRKTPLALFLVIAAACGGGSTSGATPDPGPGGTAGGSEDTPAGVAIVPGEPTPFDGEGPAFAFRNADNMRLTAGSPAELRLALRDFELAEGGNHLHLFYDDNEYIPIYDVSSDINLGELLSEHGMTLADGWHLVRAFPVLASHEGVKTDRAFDSWSFFYGEAPGQGAWDSLTPMLTYSEPRGCYAGADAERILLDFHLSRTELSADGHSVRVSIDGEIVGEPLTAWVPYYITGLTPGSHSIRLELLDSLGELEAEPFNDAERTIEVAAEGGC